MTTRHLLTAQQTIRQHFGSEAEAEFLADLSPYDRGWLERQREDDAEGDLPPSLWFDDTSPPDTEPFEMPTSHDIWTLPGSIVPLAWYGPTINIPAGTWVMSAPIIVWSDTVTPEPHGDGPRWQRRQRRKPPRPSFRDGLQRQWWDR